MAVLRSGRALAAGGAAVLLLWISPAAGQASPTQPSGTPEPESPPVDSKYQTIVTANRFEAPAGSVSSTVTVLTGEDLQARQVFSLADALREVPGLDVVRTGSLGASTAIFTRGTNSNHTLLLIDGVESSDPSSFDGAIDFADLGPEGIERVEILRGPASSLYGSDALGGVINVITRRSKGPPRFALSTEGGAHRTFRGTANATGTIGTLSYALLANRLVSGGISHASSLRGNTEADGYERTLLSGRVDARLSGSLSSTFLVRYTDADLQLDDFGLTGPIDDPDYRERKEELLLRLEGKLSLFDGRWRQSLGGFLGHHRLRADNLADLVNPASSEGDYLGQKTGVDWQHHLSLARGNDAIAVLEAEWDVPRSRSVFGGFGEPIVTELPPTSINTLAFAVQDQQQLGRVFTVTGSARMDRHSVFGSAFTYSVGAVAALFDGHARIRANHGSGFNAPTVLQLFDPNYGQPSLQPERSRSYELGAEHLFGSSGFSLGATAFRNDVDSLIAFDPITFKSHNINSARITGVESFLQHEWGAWRGRIDHTWMKPLDLATGKDLLRRPRQKAALGVSYRFPHGALSTRLLYVGARPDLDYGQIPAAEVQLAPYWRASVGGSWAVAQAVTLFGRIENLLDARYEEVLGYGAPGISAYAGIRAEL
jgi:vitamin B12 transporter